MNSPFKKEVRPQNLALLMVFLAVANLISCAKEQPQSQPQPVPPKKMRGKWYSGGGYYCQLKFEDFMLDLPYEGRPDTQLKIERRRIKNKVRSFIKHNKLQEAIWLYSILPESRTPEGESYLKKLRKKLLKTFTRKKYTVVPKNLGGTARKLLLKFDNGILGVFKYRENEEIVWAANDRAEIAAWKLDQMLNLNLVPLTLFQKYNGEPGSIQYFVTDAEEGQPKAMHARNFRAMKIFDWLIGNPDRKLPNFLMMTEDYLVAIDNGAGFGKHNCGYVDQIVELFNYEPELEKRLLSLQEGEVRAQLQKYVVPEYFEAFMSRLLTLQQRLRAKHEAKNLPTSPASPENEKKDGHSELPGAGTQPPIEKGSSSVAPAA